jgi:GNAT superfamily N-acetyltransferase
VSLPTPDILSPGDSKSIYLDPSRFTWTSIRDAEHALFPAAYEALWAEFGAAHELEPREVLAGRFALGLSMRYEMLVAQESGSIAAVRDHTAIWIDGEVVVHLSHLLVAPEWRRAGLAGWMRAAPVLVAREVAAAHGEPDAPVTLVGEMEYDRGTPEAALRLGAYEHAGFLKIDPSAVRYHQPDFRPPAEIDATGGPRPLPFQLVIRQVGEEHLHSVTGAQVRRYVRALHTMYAAQFRPRDMAHPLLQIGHLPEDGATVALVPPTA